VGTDAAFEAIEDSLVPFFCSSYDFVGGREFGSRWKVDGCCGSRWGSHFEGWRIRNGSDNRIDWRNARRNEMEVHIIDRESS